MTQTTLEDAIAQRDEALAAVEHHAGVAFREAAKAFVLAYLRTHGPTPGEDVTEACVRAGIIPHDERAFGPVYQYLSRQGLIEKCGFVLRRKGHGTAGGHVWRAVNHE